MHAIYTAPTRQHELDHTDHPYHTDQVYICPEGSTVVDHEAETDDLFENAKYVEPRYSTPVR